MTTTLLIGQSWVDFAVVIGGGRAYTRSASVMLQLGVLRMISGHLPPSRLEALHPTANYEPSPLPGLW